MQQVKQKGRKKAKGDHDIEECNHLIQGKYIHHKPLHAKEGKELIDVLEMKNTRKIIVANRDPLEIPGILPKTEFERLKKQSHVLTNADRRALLEETERKKIEQLHACAKRKEVMGKAQISQEVKLGSILEEAESEATKKNKYILQRAYEMQQEQEDEVKGINRIILASKCLAIREAQILEKQLIQRELDEEDKRLDLMMEQKRQLGLLQEQKKRAKEKESAQKFVTQIREQLKENEIHQLIEKEQKADEARLVKQMMVKLKEEELVEAKQKVLKQEQVRHELDAHTQQLEKYHKMRKEEALLSEARLKAFMKKKQEREEALEAEVREQQIAREKEITRMREAQEKQGDILAKRDEMNAYRLQEEAEREWRRKEKEKAMKVKEAITQLKRDRDQQIEDIRKAQAVEIARDQEEFHKVANLQYAAHLKEEEKKRQRRERNEKHRKEILQQVNERERVKIEMRKERFEEGNAQRIENEIRDVRVKATLQKKIENLRKCNVPEQTLADVQRQVNITLRKLK